MPAESPFGRICRFGGGASITNTPNFVGYGSYKSEHCTTLIYFLFVWLLTSTQKASNGNFGWRGGHRVYIKASQDLDLLPGFLFS